MFLINSNIYQAIMINEIDVKWSINPSIYKLANPYFLMNNTEQQSCSESIFKQLLI